MQISIAWVELIHLCVQAAEVKCIAGDLIKDPELVQRTVASEGPFDAVVHAVGMILPNSLNALASGSGSKPAEGVTPVIGRLYCVCETTDSPFVLTQLPANPRHACCACRHHV